MARRTWLTPFGDAWKRKAGADPNWKRLAGELGKLKKDIGKEGQTNEDVYAIMLAHWKEYLERTPVAYLSPTRFRETFKYWNPDARYRADVDKRLDAENRRKEAALRRESPEAQGKGLQRIKGALK